MCENTILQYKLSGFENLRLTKNHPQEINSVLIKTILINDDLTALTVVLNDGVHYSSNKTDIELYLDHICFNFIARSDADLLFPIRVLEVVKENNTINASEHVEIRESVTITRSIPASTIYDTVLNSQTLMKKNAVLYERIFKTLHNPNLIVQFMSLYQLLMELLSKGRAKIEQKNVMEYLRSHKTQYPFVSFKPTRRKNANFEEDSFTFFRNEIGHSEETNDMNLYKTLGSQISSQYIKSLNQ